MSENYLIQHQNLHMLPTILLNGQLIFYFFYIQPRPVRYKKQKFVVGRDVVDNLTVVDVYSISCSENQLL